MKYLNPEEILDNLQYIQVIPKINQMGESNMYRVTHFTRVPSHNGWETVLYYRFIGSITPNNSPNNKTGGYVYILTNNTYPNLIKIGMTTSTSERRLKGVNGSGVVDDWQVEWDYYCLRPWDLEQTIHLKLDDFRERNDREFFRMSIKQAINEIETMGTYFGGGI